VSDGTLYVKIGQELLSGAITPHRLAG